MALKNRNIREILQEAGDVWRYGVDLTWARGELDRAMQGGYDDQAARMIYILGKKKDRQAVNQLVRIARTSPEPRIVRLALAAIGRIREPRAVSGVVGLLERPRPRCEWAADA